MSSLVVDLQKIKNKVLPEVWEIVSAGQIIIKTKYGTNNPPIQNGNTFVVGMKDISDGKIITDKLVRINLTKEEKKKYLLHKGDLLLNRTNSFELVGKVGILDSNENVAFASYLVKLELNHKKVISKYLNYWLNSYNSKKNIKRIATRAIGQANVNPTEFKKHCYVFLPPLPEQKAIAGLLSVWDEAIEKTERLIEAKERRYSYLMKEYLHKGQNSNRWKAYYLSELCDPVTRKNTENNKNVLTSSAQNGLLSQLDYYKKSVSAENLTGYYLIKNGEFAYNRSSAKGYPYGATKRLENYEKGVLSTLYLCFSLKPDAPCESDFLLYLFESGIANRELRAVCQEGARSHGLLNITKSDFFGIRLFLPDIKLQKEIQSVLNSVKKEITLLKQLAEKYKTQKRGLMQKMLTGKWRVKEEVVKQYRE